MKGHWCNINLLSQMFSHVTFVNTIRNHGLFDWKTRLKTSNFDIWSV